MGYSFNKDKDKNRVDGFGALTACEMFIAHSGATLIWLKHKIDQKTSLEEIMRIMMEESPIVSKMFPKPYYPKNGQPVLLDTVELWRQYTIALCKRTIQMMESM